jgi:hypothetical protein
MCTCATQNITRSYLHAWSIFEKHTTFAQQLFEVNFLLNQIHVTHVKIFEDHKRKVVTQQESPKIS